METFNFLYYLFMFFFLIKIILKEVKVKRGHLEKFYSKNWNCKGSKLEKF